MRQMRLKRLKNSSNENEVRAMDYLAFWMQTVVSRKSLPLREATQIDGLCNAHLGPRWEFAKITLRAEPWESFDVQVKLGAKQPKFEKEGYIDAAILGLLDTLLVSGQSPLKDVRVTLLDAEEHEVDSSPNAFRMAGRDAGLKLLAVAIDQMVSGEKRGRDST
jgi:translation elongation factor EF-G